MFGKGCYRWFKRYFR